METQSRAGTGGTEGHGSELAPDRQPPNATLMTLLWSVVILLPCFWLSRIQAGDLSSHVYNAWLASFVEQGKIQGLQVVGQWTNILFDILLGWTAKVIGLAGAQRLVVAALVEVFFWGALQLIWVVSKRRPWFLAPCIAMLAYGSVFHYGFMNFYASMGLSLWALVALWAGRRVYRLFAIPLLLLAVAGSILPVGWGLSVATYAWLARRVPSRFVLGVSTGAAILLFRLLLSACFTVHVRPAQILFVSGADQLWIYGWKYVFLSASLLFLWATTFRGAVSQDREVVRGIPFQLLLITAAGVLLVPDGIEIPLYRHGLWYVPDRMSLATAVLVCCVLGAARPSRALSIAMVLLMGVYFSFLGHDAHVLNQIESEMEARLSSLPPGHRVVSGLVSSGSRIDPLCHMVDRACVGRCWSYANYEASTAAFRIRALRANGVVVTNYADSFALQKGTYVVREQFAPLYQVAYAHGTGLYLRVLSVGQVAGTYVIDW
jgi:hypothetical protein